MNEPILLSASDHSVGFGDALSLSLLRSNRLAATFPCSPATRCFLRDCHWSRRQQTRSKLLSPASRRSGLAILCASIVQPRCSSSPWGRHSSGGSMPGWQGRRTSLQQRQLPRRTKPGSRIERYALAADAADLGRSRSTFNMMDRDIKVQFRWRGHCSTAWCPSFRC